MKYLSVLVILFCCATAYAQQSPEEKAVLVIHGGAGVILKENMTPELEKAFHDKLHEALDSGYAILNNQGTSLDAVVAAIKILENSPMFNAGKGAVLTNEGKNEMDASIMDGSTKNCGAVAGVTTIKNPIEAAKAVMEKSVHVMMAGRGAETFASNQGITTVDPSYFYTERRMEQLKKVQEAEKAGKGSNDGSNWEERYSKFGTVGAVAVDSQGNIAGGTSTGGMVNKRYGRIGDSPIIGAGTYAANETCAGHGEYFIRSMVAYDIAALIGYTNIPLKEATAKVVQEKLVEMGGTGGVIAIDRNGNYSMEFNTPGMFRGVVLEDGTIKTFIYSE